MKRTPSESTATQHQPWLTGIRLNSQFNLQATLSRLSSGLWVGRAVDGVVAINR